MPKFNPVYRTSLEVKGKGEGEDRKHRVVGRYCPYGPTSRTSQVLYAYEISLESYKQQIADIQGGSPKEQEQEKFFRFLPSNPLVNAAVQMDHVALQYQVKMCPWEAHHFAHERDKSLLDMLLQIDRRLPPYDILNLGAPQHAYSIGREYSRVVYVQWRRGEVKNLRFDFDKFCGVVKEAAQAFAADEIDFTKERETFWQVRIWWD